MASASEVINKIIGEHTHDGKVDLIGIANRLKIQILQKEFTSSSDLAKAEFPYSAERPRILLNKKNDQKQNFTLVALLLASCVINPEAVQEIGVKYDVFSLRETITKNRYSNIMFLATRFAVPAEIIEKLDDSSFDIDKYAKTTQYMPEFITAVVKDSSAKLFAES